MVNNSFMAAITPHPPIIIPEVGKTETKKVEKTINAMKAISIDIVKFAPETIILVTPHSYLDYKRFNFYAIAHLTGNFLYFGAPQVTLSFENDIELLESIKERHGDKIDEIPSITDLDHGSLVPLYYLAKAGFQGKIVVFNYSALDKEDHLSFGKALREVIDATNKKIAFIASGDLSHRLIPSAPSGFSPDGEVFDNFIVNSISEGNYENIINIKPELRSSAGECAYNSLMTVFGVLNKVPLNNKVYSYEGPFGVGYLVATL